MKKLNRTKKEATDIAINRVSKYITAINLIFAKKCAKFSNKGIIDADNIEMYISECETSFEGERILQKYFSIHSTILKRLSAIKWYDENGKRHSIVPTTEIINHLISTNFIRMKSYQAEDKTNRTLSYKPGKFSRMFILTYNEFINLAEEWQATNCYNEKFDLASSYYFEVIDELLTNKFENTENIFLDYNKFDYRKDGSNGKEREIDMPEKPEKIIVEQYIWNPENRFLDKEDQIDISTTDRNEWLRHFYSDEELKQIENEFIELYKRKLAI